MSTQPVSLYLAYTGITDNEAEIIRGKYVPPKEEGDSLIQEAELNCHVALLDYVDELDEEQANMLIGDTPRFIDLCSYAAGSEITSIMASNLSLLVVPSTVGESLNNTFQDGHYLYALKYIGEEEVFTDESAMELAFENDDFSLPSRWLNLMRRTIVDAVSEKDSLAAFRLLSHEWENDPRKYAYDELEPTIRVTPSSADAYTIIMGEAASWTFDCQNYLFLSSYLSIRSTFSEMLGIPTTSFNIQLIPEKELGVIKVNDNLWIEGLVDESDSNKSEPPYHLGIYGFATPELKALREQFLQKDGLVQWLTDNKVDNLAYYEFLRHDDGASIAYSVRLFSGRKPVASFMLSPFDIKAGYELIQYLEDLDGINVVNAGDKEYNWDIKKHPVSEENDLMAFYPTPPSAPISNYSLSLIMLNSDASEEDLNSNTTIQPKALSDFDDFFLLNGTREGWIFPPMRLPLTAVTRDNGQSILIPDREFIADVIDGALEEGLSLDDADKLSLRLQHEAKLIESSTERFTVGSVVITLIGNDDFLSLMMACHTLQQDGGMPQPWRETYNENFPSLNVTQAFHYPLTDMT